MPTVFALLLKCNMSLYIYSYRSYSPWCTSLSLPTMPPTCWITQMCIYVCVHSSLWRERLENLYFETQGNSSNHLCINRQLFLLDFNCFYASGNWLTRQIEKCFETHKAEKIKYFLQTTLYQLVVVYLCNRKRQG